jgi:hypothetical protein
MSPIEGLSDPLMPDDRNLLVVHDWSVVGKCVQSVGYERQRFILDAHQVRSFACRQPVDGDHGDDGLARIARAADREHRLIGDMVAEDATRRGQVPAGENGHDARYA